MEKPIDDELLNAAISVDELSKSKFEETNADGDSQITQKKSYYKKLGFEQAIAHNGDPELIPNGLNVLYAQYLREMQLDGKELQNRIKQLDEEILLKKNSKLTEEGNVKNLEIQKEDQETLLHEAELEKIEIKGGRGPEVNQIPFVMSVLILGMLTFFLHLFYASSGNAAFNGKISETTDEAFQIINLNAYSEATNGELIFMILFPFIFIALGFLIHDGLEKKNLKIVSGLLLLTFGVDFAIGYSITSQIHMIKYNLGLVDVAWKANLILEQSEFWLFLIGGFTCYIIWGFLLNYSFQKYREITPTGKMKYQLEVINEKITRIKDKLNQTLKSINDISIKINSLQNEIDVKEQDLAGYKNGTIPINFADLKAKVGYFMAGWQTFIHNKFNWQEKIIAMTRRSEEVKNEWLENKFVSLQKKEVYE